MIKQLFGLIFGYKSSSSKFIKYLKRKGIRIGANTVFYDPSKNIIDVTRPWLIEIGANVKITSGVAILTHGYDWSVLRYKYNGEVIGSSGKVTIGDNVFIGINSIILKGINIGNNVIIGAGSVVTKSLKDNSVYAGNPAKFIMSIEDYYIKRKKEYLAEVREMAIEYQKRYNKLPPISIFREHYFLFLDRKTNIKSIKGFDYKFDKNDKNDVFLYFKSSFPLYNGYDDFLMKIMEKNDNN